MVPITARRLAHFFKFQWSKMPVEYFQPLTFGELLVDQKFICLPTPGDNDGHGGFRGVHFVLTKTEHLVKGSKTPRGKAESKRHKVTETFDHETAVILID